MGAPLIAQFTRYHSNVFSDRTELTYLRHDKDTDMGIGKHLLNGSISLAISVAATVAMADDDTAHRRTQ